jgi:hypothetical protein
LLAAQSFSTRRCRASLALAALFATSTTPGCSVSFVDGDGRRNTVGLVWLVSDPPATVPAGDFISITTVGLAASALPHHGSLALGYSRDTVLTLRNDALICGDIGRMMQE